MPKLTNLSLEDVADMANDLGREEMRSYAESRAELNRYVLITGLGIASFCLLNLTETKQGGFLLCAISLSVLTSGLMFIRMHLLSLASYADASYSFLKVLSIQQRDTDPATAEADAIRSKREGQKAETFNKASSFLFYVACFFLLVSLFCLYPLVKERVDAASNKTAAPHVELKLN